MIHPHYPSVSEVDDWCAQRIRRADAAEFAVEVSPFSNPPGVPVPRHLTGQQAVAITPADGCTFHCLWQPAHSGGPAPLLVHLPGYGAEMTLHPQLVAEGFNVLHVNPQGYCTPQRFDTSRKVDGTWPVMPDTITSFGQAGYVHWLHDVLVAVRWATQLPSVQPNRLAFFGTSQGGGTSLLLASILRDRGVKAVAADEPYLTDYRGNFAEPTRGGAYHRPHTAIEQIIGTSPERVPEAWHALGLIDTLSHAHRLTMPTLLTAGSADETCPPASIRSLFDRLPATRSYTVMHNEGHGYTAPFLYLATAWFKMYV